MYVCRWNLFVISVWCGGGATPVTVAVVVVVGLAIATGKKDNMTRNSKILMRKLAGYTGPLPVYSTITTSPHHDHHHHHWSAL